VSRWLDASAAHDPAADDGAEPVTVVYQAYRRMEEILNEKELQTGGILSASCHLMRAIPLWEKADAKYREDPHAFIGKL
jgi:hypothetical protein